MRPTALLGSARCVWPLAGHQPNRPTDRSAFNRSPSLAVEPAPGDFERMSRSCAITAQQVAIAASMRATKLLVARNA
jgi:hypothetical protein